MFQRKGTVSKSSGPVHVNSYALRGVPIRYTPPFFLPDQVSLPPSWTLPTLPSDDLFRYDYSREKAVLEQAKVRALSLAAEAQVREKREQAEEGNRRREAATAAEWAKVTTSTAALAPPLIPSPAPNSTLTQQTPPSSTADGTTTATPPKTDSNSGIHIKDSADVLKPLGQMSLIEFEGDNFNPFDTASLQAINDMEVLQTISLAPPPPAPSESPATPDGVLQLSDGGNMLPASPGQSSVSNTQPVSAIPSSVTTASITATVSSGHPLQQIPLQFSGLPLPPIAAHPQPTHLTSSCGSGVLSTSPSQTSSAPHAATAHPYPSLPILPVLPPISTSLTPSHSAPTHTTTPSSQPSSSHPNPPMYPPRSQGTPQQRLEQPPSIPASSSPPVSVTHTQPSLSPYPSLVQPPTHTQFAPLPGTSPTAAPYLPVQPPQTGSGGASVGGEGDSGGVGDLVSIGDGGGGSTVGQPTARKAPVPKPRAVNAGQQVPNSAHLPYPSGPAHLPSPPAVAAPTIQARANSLMASLPAHGQTPISRPGLGVAVLPPIPSSSHQAPPSHPHPAPPSRPHPAPRSHPAPHSQSTPSTFPTPPPYQPQSPESRSSTPPPPYYTASSDGARDMRRFSQPPSQQHSPSQFTLPDPQLSLSPEERSEVESISGMGFPAPRVARAVKKFTGNRTQVLDFLILVGIIEESSGSRGDGAEVALAVCDNNETKAKRYLEKVTYYKESGFDEKRIHEAFEKAGNDWDRALDILAS